MMDVFYRYLEEEKVIPAKLQVNMTSRKNRAAIYEYITLRERKTCPIVDKDGSEIGVMHTNRSGIQIKVKGISLFIANRSRKEEAWWKNAKEIEKERIRKSEEACINNDVLKLKCAAAGRKGKPTKRGKSRRPYNIQGRSK